MTTTEEKKSTVNYLVIYCGHEGIEHIVGLFDEDGARQIVADVYAKRIQETAEWQALEIEHKQADAQFMAAIEHDPASHCCMTDFMEPARFDRHYLLRALIGAKPNRLCVQYVDATGARCVCGELGVHPEGTESWMM